MNQLSEKLTQYREGSIQELWTVSYPLILSILSVNLMTFLDRLILAKFDTHAMNAAVIASLLFSVFQLAAIGVASISEVFVGQYNGAKKLTKMGVSVWQSIWFSLLTGCIFIPLGLWAGPYLITNPDYILDGVPFFKTLMLFGPTFPLVAALSSFFTGRGRMKLVVTTTILSNVLNILLDFILIFGIDNLLSPMGAKGAAMATGIAQTVQAVVLMVVFLKSAHRHHYGTNQWKFKPTLFWQFIKIGMPNCISILIESTAWCVLAQILMMASEAHITIFSIGDSFVVLFAFGFWGLQKGITTVASNHIGANREEVIAQSLGSGIKIIIAMMLFFAIPMFVFPEMLAEWFLNNETSLLVNEQIKTYSAVAMRWIWIYFMFDAIAWLICGVLTASGNTKFVMIMNIVNAWVFSVIPTYIWVVHFNGSLIVSWILCTLYSFMNILSFYVRYKSKRFSSEPLHALLN